MVYSLLSGRPGWFTGAAVLSRPRRWKRVRPPGRSAGVGSFRSPASSVFRAKNPPDLHRRPSVEQNPLGSPIRIPFDSRGPGCFEVIRGGPRTKSGGSMLPSENLWEVILDRIHPGQPRSRHLRPPCDPSTPGVLAGSGRVRVNPWRLTRRQRRGTNWFAQEFSVGGQALRGPGFTFEECGFEAWAFYAPIHSHEDDVWGIYLINRRIHQRPGKHQGRPFAGRTPPGGHGQRRPPGPHPDREQEELLRRQRRRSRARRSRVLRGSEDGGHEGTWGMSLSTQQNARPECRS